MIKKGSCLGFLYTSPYKLTVTAIVKFRRKTENCDQEDRTKLNRKDKEIRGLLISSPGVLSPVRGAPKLRISVVRINSFRSSSEILAVYKTASIASMIK